MVLSLKGVCLYTSPDTPDTAAEFFHQHKHGQWMPYVFLDEAAAYIHCLFVPSRSSSQSSDSSKKQIMEIPSSHTATAAAGNGERHTGGVQLTH